MGRYQYIAYSVGFDPDHDHNFVIKSDFLPDPVWERFKEQILGSVKTDYITDALVKPRWLFSRFNGYSLFGIATLNANLSSEEKYAKDYVGRTGHQLRAFLGIVCEGSFSNLPMDIIFFRHVYKELIEPKWYSEKDDPDYYQIGKSAPSTYDSQKYRVVSAKPLIPLNIDNNKVRFLNGQTDIINFMASSMAADNDIACIGMIKESHKGFAAMIKYHYNNVIVEGQTMDEDIPLKEEKAKREEKKEAKNSSKPITFDGFEDTDINNGDDDRKMFGGSKKAIASVALVILLLVLLVILLLKKK